jgi:hypothetical protein
MCAETMHRPGENCGYEYGLNNFPDAAQRPKLVKTGVPASANRTTELEIQEIKRAFNFGILCGDMRSERRF